MHKAYWVICHRSTKSPEKFAAFTELAYPAIQAAAGGSWCEPQRWPRRTKAGLTTGRW
jgi:hypothetical protein